MEAIKIKEYDAICCGCGKTIEGEFLFCPWCGVSQDGKDNERSIDVVFARLEELQRREKEKRLEKIRSQIDTLDKELSSIVMSVEMHR